jgi:hypothetical protein
MEGVVPLLAGLALLWLAWSERRKMVRSRRDPARWWSLRPRRTLEPSSALELWNVVIGTVLGVAGVVFGLILLVT